MKLISTDNTLPSLCRATESMRLPLRIGLVQHHFREDPHELRRILTDAIGTAAGEGAEVVFLPELTLSAYPASQRAGDNPGAHAESLLDGPTFDFAQSAAEQHGVLVHASLYERSESADGLGLNTAILVSPATGLIGRTRKMHIPVTEGYFEDTYFRGGPPEDAYPVYSLAELNGARLGLPTCWDEWFPEVARLYSLGGAELLVYPTAIGSEPSFPDFDTRPLWQQVIVGNGIANGTFMAVPNRTGSEAGLDFYGSSFVSDPFGRILVAAPRDEEAVLVADLDLDQRRDWLELFPFLSTRRPSSYGRLAEGFDPWQLLPKDAASSGNAS
jgi:N-carbamoylputrescine amidase